ncbi:MAG TPA: hypothetical protein VE732_08690, partial [Nitrososphaera sp.]|nr:hypothetical protein [Nitrososphaera sp.]
VALMITRKTREALLENIMNSDCIMLIIQVPRLTPELTGRGREAYKIMANDKHERNAIPRSG